MDARISRLDVPDLDHLARRLPEKMEALGWAEKPSRLKWIVSLKLLLFILHVRTSELIRMREVKVLLRGG